MGIHTITTIRQELDERRNDKKVFMSRELSYAVQKKYSFGQQGYCSTCLMVPETAKEIGEP
jgi:hypothetical protein